jgi:hypothetical protein
MKEKASSSSVERGICAKLLQHLADEGARASLTLDEGRTNAIERLATKYRPLHGRELEGLLARDPMKTGDKGAIHLRPVLKGTPALLPVMRAYIDLSGERPDAQLRVALFDIDGTADNVVGWRFETPSKGDDENSSRGSDTGMHDYHHAQPITALTRGQRFSDDQWYNETTPAFLLDAYSPASLIIAMLVSLYGITYTDELLKVDFRNEVRSVAKDMMSVQEYWKRRAAASSVEGRTAKRS